MTTILITGGAGQVGLELAACAWPADVTLLLPDRTELDLGSAESITTYFANHQIDAVINPAAYTAVDKAESDVAAAFLANGQGPAWLAEATRNAGIPIVHVSTDYVFDGSQSDYYRETDPVKPIGAYGASKLAGELAVQSANPRSAILRTAWVLSPHRGNFLKTMLRVGAERPELSVVADQIGCPTSATDIAQALQTIILKMIADKDAPTGIYHFVNAGEASWHKLATTIFAMAEAYGRPVPIVNAITTDQYPTPARRPANSRLAANKIQQDYGISPRPWEDAVSDIITILLTQEKGTL